ncbi:hypothetical protein D3C71_1255060 [compost metagenome]
MNDAEDQGGFIKAPARNTAKAREHEIEAGEYRERNKELPQRQHPEGSPVLQLGAQQYGHIFEVQPHRLPSLHNDLPQSPLEKEQAETDQSR